MGTISNLFTFSNILTWLKILIDFAIIWVIVYYLLKLVQNNLRTMQLFKGILIIIVLRLIFKTLDLSGVEYVLDAIMSWGVVALIVIFQPEIRNLLEKLGQVNLNTSSFLNVGKEEKEEMINELTKAVNYLATNRVGAIISIERSQSLDDYIMKATALDAKITYELLLTIFYEGTTLHDGGVIIRGNRIACASAFYEPTKQELPPVYGARHRASIGLSETSDALTIVVSEETGNVSFAISGELIKVPLIEFKDQLSNQLFQNTEGVTDHE